MHGYLLQVDLHPISCRTWYLNLFYDTVSGVVGERSLSRDGEIGGISLPEDLPRGPIFRYRMPNTIYIDIILAYIAVSVGEPGSNIVVVDPHDVPADFTAPLGYISLLLVCQFFFPFSRKDSGWWRRFRSDVGGDVDVFVGVVGVDCWALPP